MKSTSQFIFLRGIFLRVVSLVFVLGVFGASASAQMAKRASAARGTSNFGLTKKHDGGKARLGGGAGTSVPVAAQPGISAALGHDDSRYQVRAVGDGLRAENPQQGLAAEFTAQGIELRSGAAQWGLALRAYGYGDALQAASPAAPQGAANRVEYRRGALTEWYVNGPLGMEQGFGLAERPGRSRGEALTIALEVSKGLSPSVDPGGKGVTLTQRDGQAKLRYAGLIAYDATGRELRSWLEARGDNLLLHVEDAGARYPVAVDPFIQLAQLTASDGAALDSFGGSVTLSADGSTLVIGACQCVFFPGSGPGAAYVFVKPTSGWATTSNFTAKLTASDGAAGNAFGVSVAISSDGSTLVVGAYEATLTTFPGPGAAYVFLKPTSGWATTSTFAAKLTASDGAACDQFGFSVGISGDGSALAVGSPVINIGQGAAYVFVKPASGWATTSTFTAKLTASDGVANDDLGYSVAINSDGSTLVSGGIQVRGGPGAAYVFLEPTSGWATETETAMLTASDGVADDQFGESVAISGDGSTLAVGAPFNNLIQGAAYVFVKPASGWATTTETAKLTASDGGASELFGWSLATSSDGSAIVAGSLLQKLHSSSVQGVVHVFLKPASGWTAASNLGSKLPAHGPAFDFLAIFVAISDDGSTAVVATPFAQVGSNSNQGMAFLLGQHRRR